MTSDALGGGAYLCHYYCYQGLAIIKLQIFVLFLCLAGMLRVIAAIDNFLWCGGGTLLIIEW